MNWFERYGIPGIYFVLLLSVLYWIFFWAPTTPPNKALEAFEVAHKAFGVALGAFGVALAASIPIGYILVIFSQYIYLNVYRLGVHANALEEAGGNLEEEKEWWAETEATILARLKCCDNQVNKGKWIQGWFMKRFDVLSINSALMLATVLAWDLLGLLCWLYLRTEKIDIDENHLLVFGSITCGIFLILIGNTYVLTKQAKRIAIEYYKQLLNN